MKTLGTQLAIICNKFRRNKIFFFDIIPQELVNNSVLNYLSQFHSTQKSHHKRQFIFVFGSKTSKTKKEKKNQNDRSSPFKQIFVIGT